MITPETARSDYRRSMLKVGWPITLRRMNASPTPPTEKTVLGRIVSLSERELVNGLKQGESKAIVLAEDIEASGITLPLRTTGTDKIVDGALVYNIQASDPQSRKLAGVVVAYELIIRGAA